MTDDRRLARVHEKLDTVGACLSFACAIHCVAMPFVITILPLLGLGVLAHSEFDTIMFITTISLASASLCWGTFVHRETRILFLLAAAILLFYVGGFHAHDTREAVFVGFGGFCLALGHFINRRLCKSCRHCCEHEHVAEVTNEVRSAQENA